MAGAHTKGVTYNQRKADPLEVMQLSAHYEGIWIVLPFPLVRAVCHLERHEEECAESCAKKIVK